MASRTVTRRHVLAAVAGGAGGLAAFGLLPVLERFVSGETPAAELTQARFTGLVGTSFRVGLSQGGTATLRLAEVKPINPLGVPSPSGEGFSLRFSGVAADGFGQDTYEVTHSSLGRFGMFLVPVGPAGADQQYEAVFNRLWK